MSKLSKTNLTPSRKARLRRLRQSRRLAALEEINTRCQHAITLAELLEAGPVNAEAVRSVGERIRAEVRAMQTLLETIWPEATR